MVGALASGSAGHAAHGLEADLRIRLFERTELEAEVVERELGGLIRAQLAAHGAFDLLANRRLVERTQRGLFDGRRFRAGLRHLDGHFARGLATRCRAVGQRQAFARGIRITQRVAEVEIDGVGVAAAGHVHARADIERIEVDAARTAGIEIEIDADRATAAAAIGEHRIFGGNLLAHDDDLFPLAHAGLRSGCRRARGPR